MMLEWFKHMIESEEETCLDFNLSERTVIRQLKESGLSAKKAATKPYLKPEHREARMNCVPLFDCELSVENVVFGN